MLLTGCTSPSQQQGTKAEHIPVKEETTNQAFSLPKRVVPKVTLATKDRALAEIQKISAKMVISKGASVGKKVALTFDDGPDENFTPQVLDILKQEQVPATFFVIGRSAKYYPDVLKRIIQEGHVLGNHSWSHPVLSKLTSSQIQQQLGDTNQVIYDITGKKPVLMRPPYGAKNQLVIDEVKKNSMKVILWSVDTRDWDHRTKSEILTVVRNQTTPGGIILQHSSGNEGLKESVAALPQLIKELKSKGYQFVTLDDLLHLPAYQE